MNRWKVAFFLSFLLSLFLLANQLLLIVDRGKSASHFDQGYKDLRGDFRNLAELYPKGEASSELLTQLRSRFPEEIIVEEERYIQMNGLRFEFDSDGLLERIEIEAYFNEYSEH